MGSPTAIARAPDASRRAGRRAEDRDAPGQPAGQRLPGPLIFLAVGSAYLALSQYVLALNDPVRLGAGFWPAAGVTLGALLLLPTRRWGWVLAAVAVAETAGDLAYGYPVGATLWWAAGNTLEPMVGAVLIRRFGSHRGALVPLRPLLAFLAFGVLVGPLVGGTVGSVGTVTGFGTPLAQVWPKFVVGDGLGVLVVAPVLLTWRERGGGARLGERIALTASLALVTPLVFRDWPGPWEAGLPYLVLPLLVWAALRHGVRGTAWTVLVVTQVANWATANGYGPFAVAGAESGHAVTLLQLFLLVASGSAFVVAALAADLSTRDEVERRLRAQAEEDALTGLPNRAWLNNRLDVAVVEAAAGGRRLAVFVCDVDRFKVVNDSLGHAAGDRLIAAVADRMRGSVRPGDVVARLGGDEYVVVLDGATDEVVDTIADRLLDAVAEPLRLDGATELVPSLSVGIAISGPGATAATLLRDADAALYRSKELGRGRASRFDAPLRARVLDRLMIESDLLPALTNGQLFAVYQPEIDLRTGELFGLEALARWHHPTSGEVDPVRFVPVAAATGASAALFRHILTQALTAQARWYAVLGYRPNIAVNLSPGQLHDPALVAYVEAALERAGAPADSLWLEVTEDVLSEATGLSALVHLRELGVRLGIDDFGTGWSSMERLSSFSWDLIKIDRTFVARLTSSNQADHIVQAIIDMAHALGIATVAEGVETPAQLTRLRDLGCDIVQGFLMSPPLHTTLVAAWLARRGWVATAGPRSA